MRGFSLGATAGSLAGNMWCTKITAECVRQFILGHCEAWSDWHIWFIVFGAIFFAVSNLNYMVASMREFEALFIVSIIQGSNIVTNCISASVVLGEMDGSTWWRRVGFSISICTILAGMAFLAGASGLNSQRLAKASDSSPVTEGAMDVVQLK